MYRFLALLALVLAPFTDARALAWHKGRYKCCDKGFRFKPKRWCPRNRVTADPNGFCRRLKRFTCCGPVKPPKPSGKCCDSEFELVKAGTCPGEAALASVLPTCPPSKRRDRECCGKSRLEPPGGKCCGDAFELVEQGSCPGTAALATVDDTCPPSKGDGKECCGKSRLELPDPPSGDEQCCDSDFELKKESLCVNAARLPECDEKISKDRICCSKD